ncbi:MAG: ATP phosphoribosyltransferase regulatory subunit [Sutterellaceae bacterium]|nr:ATP phosphoribosyltransferase regulatory subunit [Sutterellaceae bacterium]MDD7441940.1 ATP phosphoribosyltransferase regulatory subunit [Sutterellaceae bacterium]MDY2867776.1 ATP phosphoribosyltransferase regulatory subunit [Mesosutterella sp.]
MKNWVLPDHIADMLPRQTRELETMRTKTLGLMRTHGFEVIRPPMFEFLDSLLTGSGHRLERTTIKFVDEASGKLAGFRADITPQVARIDAHILSRTGITRLCYAGSVLHSRPRHPLATRQPYVVGAEMFGATGREADLEMIRLAAEAEREVGIRTVHIALGHTGVVRSILRADPAVTDESLHGIVDALGDKDPEELSKASEKLSDGTRKALSELCLIYGGDDAISRMRGICSGNPDALRAVDELEWVAGRCGADSVTIDGASVAGFDYYTGISFEGLVEGLPEPVLRGGRYDGIGLAFGRFRPAVGFTLYLRELAVMREPELPFATVAPAAEDRKLDQLVKKIRNEGQIVVQLLPGEDPKGLEESFRVTKRIVFEKGEWQVKPASGSSI